MTKYVWTDKATGSITNYKRYNVNEEHHSQGRQLASIFDDKGRYKIIFLDEWTVETENEVEDIPVEQDSWDEASRGPKMSNTEGLTIYKYPMPVLEHFEMKLPQGAEIIRVDDQDGYFWMWAVVDTNAPLETREFRACKTGGSGLVKGEKTKYIGFCKIFVQMELGLYIFEVLK